MDEKYERGFKTHKARIVENTDRYLIIDWRREDGCSDYYCNFIVDKLMGNFIVSGDIGYSVATWRSKLKPEELKDYIYNDIYYYVSKLQTASDTYCYRDEDVIADIKSNLEDEDIQCYLDTHVTGIKTIDDFWKYVENEVKYECSADSVFIPSKELKDRIEEMNDNAWEWLPQCGKRIHPRVYLWAAGFYMACEQLDI